MAKEFITLVDNDKLTLSKLETDPFGTNAYLLRCKVTGECALIDAPGNADTISMEIGNARLRYILITHAHMDHTMALEALQKLYSTSTVLSAHESETEMIPVQPDRLLKDGEILPCGQLEIEVIHTPGHTAGALCFRVEMILLGGDTVFPGGPGKTNSAENFRTLLASIQNKIVTLPDQIIIFPGHGDPTSVEEVRSNIEAFLARAFDDNLYGDVTW